jgi:phage-related minor tail protein
VVGAAIGAVSLPVVIVIAAIAAVIAAGVALYKNWDKIKEVAGVVFESVKEGIGNAIEAIKGFFGSAVEKGKNLVTSFKDLGKNIIQGLIDGFMGMLGKVKDAVGNIAGTITGGFKKLLGINSPSKVFAGFGENTGEGFIEGIKATKRDIDKATADMVNLDGMQTSLGNVNAGVSSGATKGTVRHVIDMNLNVTGETGQLNIQHIAAAVEQKIVEAITNGDRRVGSRPRLVMG